MKEGGINASEGANAIKSGLASLINPSQKASQFLQSFGINVKGIVEADKGNLKKTVVDFAKALDTLDPLNRARAIEQMFGKFQFSRISTLFQNVIAEGSQAQQVAELSKNSAEELAILSEREMKKISDSPMFKFQKSIQDMQAKLAPVGEAFLKAITPIVEFVGKILDGFNNLSSGAKSFITILVTAVAGIGPLLLMTFGLIANGIANIMKLFTNIKAFINKTTKPSDIIGEQTKYMTTEQLNSAAIADSLDQAHAKLKQTFTSETEALRKLTEAYRQAVQAQQGYAGIPGVPVGNPNATPPKKYANGVSYVPGPRGAGDIIPALLSPGEAVIPAKHAQKYAPVIAGMVSGNLPGFESGTTGVGMRQSTIGPLTEKQTEGLLRTGKTLKEISDEVYAGPYGQIPPEQYIRQIEPTKGHSFPAFEVGGIYEKADGTRVFVKPQIDLTSALAEVRGTQIARDAHQLVTPMQKIVTMMDPTDPEGRRKFIALESPLSEQIANIKTSFTKDEYFKQLVASLLRGDKDLGIGNLGGNVLADVGPAGVFQRASGKRQLGGRINSMEEQAIINLLGVKGGAKRFFAEATSEIARGMSPDAYDAAMKAEIASVLSRFPSVINSFGSLTPEEKAAYADMENRLKQGSMTDWRKYQGIHSAVTPKKYKDGGIVGYLKGSKGIKKESDYTPQEIYELLKIQEAHAYGEMDIKDKNVQEQLKRVFSESSPEDFNKFKILSNLTMSLPGKLNQLIKETGNGVQGPIFSQAYNALRGKLSKTAKMSGVKNMSDAQTLEDIIGTKFVGEPLIKDSIFAKIVESTINEQTANVSQIGSAANLIWERTKQVGTVRPKRDNLDTQKWNELITTMLQNDELVVVPGNENGFPVAQTPFGGRFGRIMSDGIGSSKTAEGRAIRKLAQDAANQWAKSGNHKLPLPLVDLGNGNVVQLKWRDNSAKPGTFSSDEFPAYDDKSKKYASDLSFAPGGLNVLKNLGYFAKGGIIPGGQNEKYKYLEKDRGFYKTALAYAAMEKAYRDKKPNAAQLKGAYTNLRAKYGIMDSEIVDEYYWDEPEQIEARVAAEWAKAYPGLKLAKGGTIPGYAKGSFDIPGMGQKKSAYSDAKLKHNILLKLVELKKQGLPDDAVIQSIRSNPEFANALAEYEKFGQRPRLNVTSLNTAMRLKSDKALDNAVGRSAEYLEQQSFGYKAKKIAKATPGKIGEVAQGLAYAGIAGIAGLGSMAVTNPLGFRAATSGLGELAKVVLAMFGLHLNKGGVIPGYEEGTPEVLPQGFSAMPTQAEKDAQVAFVQNSPLAQLQRGDALASLVAKSTIGKGNQMFRVPTIRQNEELATKKVGDIVDIGNRFTSIADQTQLQAIGMTAAGKLNTGNRERAVNTILKLVAGYDMPGIMNHNSYNPDYKKQAFGEKGGAEYPFQSEGVLPPGLKGKITNIAQSGDQKIIEVLIQKLAKGGIIPGYANGGFIATQKPKASVFDIDDTLLDLSSFMPAHEAKNEKLPKDQRTKWHEEAAKNPKGIPAAIERLRAAQARGNKILLMTARPQSYDMVTMDTLQKLGIDTNNVKLISRASKDYRKPEQMKFDKTSKYMQWYDIEEFYDDLAETRAAINQLGINAIDPLALAKGGIIPGKIGPLHKDYVPPITAKVGTPFYAIETDYEGVNDSDGLFTSKEAADAYIARMAKEYYGNNKEMQKLHFDRTHAVPMYGSTMGGPTQWGINVDYEGVAPDWGTFPNKKAANNFIAKYVEQFNDPEARKRYASTMHPVPMKINKSELMKKLAKGGIIPGYAKGGIIGSIWNSLSNIGTQDGEFSDRQLGGMVKYVAVDGAFPKNFKQWEPNDEFSAAFRKYSEIKKLEYSIPAMEKFVSMYKPGMKKEQLMIDMYDSEGGKRLFRRGNPELSGLVSKSKEQQLARIEQVKQQVAQFYQSKEYAMLQGAKGKNASAWLMQQLRRMGKSNVYSAIEMKDRFADKKENIIIGAEVSAHEQKIENAIDEGLSPGEIALLKQEALRHRTTSRLKVGALKHPKDAGSKNGRYFGPGMYFAEDQLDSKKLFSDFGNNVYKLDLSDEEKEFVRNSKGYIDEATMIQKAKEYKHLLRDRGINDAWFGDKTIRGVFGAKWTDPFIQKLMEEGYIGYQHGKAFTDWYVGSRPGYGLKKTKYANGGIIPGYAKGTSKVDEFAGYDEYLGTPEYYNCPHGFVFGEGCPACRKISNDSMYKQGYKKCTAQTKTGQRCKNFAEANEQLCSFHKKNGAEAKYIQRGTQRPVQSWIESLKLADGGYVDPYDDLPSDYFDCPHGYLYGEGCPTCKKARNNEWYAQGYKKCTAQTKNGKRCQNWANPNEQLCNFHKKNGAEPVYKQLGIAREIEKPYKFANGVFSVPGPKGAGDVVPAMLSPGEAVIPADSAARHRGLITKMIAGDLPGYANGGIIPGYAFGTPEVPGQNFGFPGFGERPLKVIIIGDETKINDDTSKVQKEVAKEQKAAAKDQKDAAKESKKSDKDIRDAIIKDKQEARKMQQEAIAEQRKITANQERVKANYDQMTDKEKAKFDEKLNKKYEKEDKDLQKQYDKEDKGPSKFSKLFKANKFTAKATGIGYMASGVVGLATQIPGGIGQAAQAALPAIGAMTSAMSMIPGPAGMVVGGLMAVATIAGQIEAHFKALREESAKNVRALGASTQAMSKLSEFAKKVGSRELMDKRRETSASSFFYIRPGKKTFGESYMESEAGKELTQETSSSLKSKNPQVTSKLILSQMGTAITEGILSPEQARSIVSNLAKQLKNTQFGIDVNAKITAMYGPDGTPLDYSKNSIKLAMDAVLAVASETGVEGATKAAALAESTVAAMNSIQAATDALAANPKATKEEKDALTQYAQQTMTQLYDQTVKGQSELGNQFADSARESLTKAYEGTGFEDVAKSTGEAIQNFDAYSHAQETFFTQVLASKVIGTTQMQTAMNLNISGDVLTELIKTNPTALNQLLGVAGSMDKETGAALISNQAGQTSEQMASTASALELTGKTTGVFAMDETSKKAIQKYYANEGLDKAKEIDRIYKELDNKKTTITVDTVTSVAGDNLELKEAMKNGKVSSYFNKLKDKKNKIIFTTEFNSLLSADEKLIPAIKLWAAAAGKSTNMTDTELLATYKVEYAFSEAQRVTDTGALQDLTFNPDDASNGTPEASILDKYVKMLREGSNYAQKLTTGWTASYNALSKYGTKAIDQMAGIASLMKQYGGDTGIINDFLGGTEEEQNRIIDKSTGKLRAGAGELIAKLKQIKDMQEYGLSYVLASPAERLQKDNELYQAGLDVIGAKEKKINDKYDKRIKALDEIGKIQEKNNQLQKDTLTLADALSKGDIAAAARAAMQTQQDSQKQALEDAKANIENARKAELEAITVKILGHTKHRSDLEQMISDNSQKIAEYKLIEMNRQTQIGKDALIAAKASAEQLKNGKALASLSKGTGGGSGNGNKGNPTGQPSATQDAKGNPIGTRYDSQGQIDVNGKYNDQGKLIKPAATAAEIKKLQTGASVAGLTAAKENAQNKLNTKRTSVQNKFGLNYSDLYLAVKSKDMQSVYGKVKKDQRAEFAKEFSNLTSLQDVVDTYNDLSGNGDILNSAAGKEASQQLLDALPENDIKAITLVKERVSSYATELIDYLAKQKAYKDAANKLNVGNVAWEDMTPENKEKLETLHTAYIEKNKFMFQKHKDTNAAVDTVTKLSNNGLDLNSVGIGRGYLYKNDITNKEVRNWQTFASGGLVLPKPYAGGGIVIPKGFSNGGKATKDKKTKDKNKGTQTTDLTTETGEKISKPQDAGKLVKSVTNKTKSKGNHITNLGGPRTSSGIARSPGGGMGMIGGILEMMHQIFADGGVVVPKGYAIGGGIYGTDTVPAMLTPGEFVIRKSAVDAIGVENLQKLNGYANGGLVGGTSSTTASDSVYNYSITVNANSSDANDIANAVLNQIKRIDSQRLRSNVI